MEEAAHESCFPGAGEVEADPWFPALYPGHRLGLWGGIFCMYEAQRPLLRNLDIFPNFSLKESRLFFFKLSNS